MSLAENGGNVAEPPRVRTLLDGAASAGVARLDAELLLAALLRVPRTRLIAFDERTVDMLTTHLYRAAVERRLDGEPVAYITGVREFWSLPFTVTPGVLVPRPETELLVEICLARLDAQPHRIADLGTGSGAIALALARERPQWQLVATDRSPNALTVADANRTRLQLPGVELRQGSWCEPLARERFDAIISNPPYIAAGDPALSALQYEPPEALVAADAGFADLLTIANQARCHLNPRGLLLLEHGSGQAIRLLGELHAMGYAQLRSHADAAGHDRVLEAIWP